MEGLTSISQSHFDSSRKFKAAHTYEAYGYSPGIIPDIMELTENNISSWLSQHELEEDASDADSDKDSEFLPLAFNYGAPEDALIRLVRIKQHADTALDMTEETFRLIIESMRAAPGVLYLVCQGQNGFHEFNPKDIQYLPTKFFGNDKFALLWTFNASVSSTSVVLFERGGEVFSDFCEMLTEFSEYHTAYMITFLTAVFQVHLYDKETREDYLPIIQEIEGYMGYGPNKGDGPAFRVLCGPDNVSHAVEKLTNWSQQVREIAFQLGNKVQHQTFACYMLDELTQGAYIKSERSRFIDEVRGAQNVLSVKSLKEAAPNVRQQLLNSTNFQLHLKERTDKLSGTLNTVLSHQNAIAGAALASKPRMKTVAFMTMAVLPVLFLVALFATGPLEWGPTVTIFE